MSDRPTAAPRTPSSRLRPFLPTALLAALGAGLAAAYAHFVGCRTGTCLITSNVWTAGAYGALVGGLVGWPGRRKDGGTARSPDEPDPDGAASSHL